MNFAASFRTKVATMFAKEGPKLTALIPDLSRLRRDLYDARELDAPANIDNFFDLMFAWERSDQIAEHIRTFERAKSHRSKEIVRDLRILQSLFQNAELSDRLSWYHVETEGDPQESMTRQARAYIDVYIRSIFPVIDELCEIASQDMRQNSRSA